MLVVPIVAVYILSYGSLAVVESIKRWSFRSLTQTIKPLKSC